MSIEIANPRRGQATHTSANRADHLCRTGQAYMSGGKLVIAKSAGEREEYERVMSDVTYWQGSYKGQTLHRPGEVRS